VEQYGRGQEPCARAGTAKKQNLTEGRKDRKALEHLFLAILAVFCSTEDG
jgi:hypothetical protein